MCVCIYVCVCVYVYICVCVCVCMFLFSTHRPHPSQDNSCVSGAQVKLGNSGVGLHIVPLGLASHWPRRPTSQGDHIFSWRPSPPGPESLTSLISPVRPSGRAMGPKPGFPMLRQARLFQPSQSLAL